LSSFSQTLGRVVLYWNGSDLLFCLLKKDKMHALEMEEVESLVGAGSRRKATASRARGKKNDMLASVALNKTFLTRVVVVACLAIFALLYTSAVEVDKVDKVDIVRATPVESPPAPTTSSASTPTGSTTESTAGSTAGSTTGSSSGNGDSSSGKVEDESYMYSKFAVVRPLVDHPLPNDATKQALAETWGHWHFWDGDEDMRPKNDYLSKYPHRDIPGDEFPEDAWQADAVFVNHYLNDADQLISRAMEAIFTEYGHGKPLPPEELAARMQMFHWNKVDLKTATGPPEKYTKRGDHGNGGWTTTRSFDGLVRRLLHAMMTSDTFTVVMGGHSASQGQG
jgi:hypothetical protein